MIGGTAFAASTAFAEKVEVDLTGSQASMDNGVFASALNLDLTGDGIDDLSSSTFFGSNLDEPDNVGIVLNLGGSKAMAAHGKRVFTWVSSTTAGKTGKVTSTFTGFRFKVGSSSFSSTTPQEFSGYLPVTFSDESINGGQESNGWVEVRVASTDPDDHTIDLVRFIYDDASTEAPDVHDNGGGGGDWEDFDWENFDWANFDWNDPRWLTEGYPFPIAYLSFARGGIMEKGGTSRTPKGPATLKRKLRDLEKRLSQTEKRIALSIKKNGKSSPVTRANGGGRPVAVEKERALDTRRLAVLKKQVRNVKLRLRRR